MNSSVHHPIYLFVGQWLGVSHSAIHTESTEMPTKAAAVLFAPGIWALLGPGPLSDSIVFTVALGSGATDTPELQVKKLRIRELNQVVPGHGFLCGY